MPELPEVETVVRGLRPDLVGRRCGEAHASWPGVLAGESPRNFSRRIAGQEIQSLSRRGKYICIHLERDFLVIHLRMTGRLYLSPVAEGRDAWVRLSLGLGPEHYLIFSDARKFGRVLLVPDLVFLEEKLGPEPLDLAASDFKKLFVGSRRAVKTFLLDQKKLAGVGNIYADEALFLAGIRPTRPVDRLRVGERVALGEAVQQVLNQAIEHEGASISWYRKPDGKEGESQKHFRVYGRREEPCYQCGTTLSKIVLGQRGTHFCPSCQS